MPKNTPKLTPQAWLERLRAGQFESMASARKSSGKTGWRPAVKEAARVVAESYFKDGPERFDPSRLAPYLERPKSVLPAKKGAPPLARKGAEVVAMAAISAAQAGVLAPRDLQSIEFQLNVIRAGRDTAAAYESAKAIDPTVDTSELAEVLKQIGNAWTVLSAYAPILARFMPVLEDARTRTHAGDLLVNGSSNAPPKISVKKEKAAAALPPVELPPALPVGDPSRAIAAAKGTRTNGAPAAS